MNQSRYLTEYNIYYCGSNITYYNYTLVGPTYINTSWSDWYVNGSCLSNDTGSLIKNLTQYDIYRCASNTTYYNSTYSSCSYANPVLNSITITPASGPEGTIFNITVNATDNTNISSVRVYIQKPDGNNTAQLNLSIASGLYQGSWNSSGSSDGTYKLDILFNDTYGNSVLLDNKAGIGVSDYIFGVYHNYTLPMYADSVSTIDSRSSTNSSINITPDLDLNSSISIIGYTRNARGIEASGVTSIGKYIDFVVDNITNNHISIAAIKIYYSDAEVTAANLQESALRLYKFNETSNEWFELTPGGVDVDNNYVWANITRFSSFAIYGSLVSSIGGNTGGGGGGGGGGSSSTQQGAALQEWICEPKFICSEWTDCRPDNTIRRICKQVDDCPEKYDKPSELMYCIYEPSCSNKIKDGKEEGVDCGGKCKPCPSCHDYTLNQDEEDVDCGGPCKECTKNEMYSPQTDKISKISEMRNIINDLYLGQIIKNKEIILSSVAILLLVIGIIRFYRVRKTDKKENYEKKPKTYESRTDELSQKNTKYYESYKKLIRYINLCLDKGTSINQIKRILIKAGWKKDIVKRAIRLVIKK
jgi:hypothetical protein